ncbi:hypothetical protein YPPY92_1863, partial [Yersinia pestis PY-92]
MAQLIVIKGKGAFNIPAVIKIVLQTAKQRLSSGFGG